MFPSLVISGAALALSVTPWPVAAQPQETAVPRPNNNGNAQDAKAAFDAAFQAYKTELATIEAMRSEFQTADANRREEIDAELRKRHPQSAAVLESMVNSAVAAYRAAPESDPEVTNLLVTIAGHRMLGSGKNRQGGDDYEAALEVINALIDGGNSNPQLPVMGLFAAFVTNELDLAEKYKQIALQSGALTDPPENKNEALQELYARTVQMAQSIPRQRKLWDAEEKIRDAEAQADDLPRVSMETTEGTVTLELFENEAPQAVANFVTLVKEEFYNGVVFHRVLPQFMAQGGDPTGNGTGGPGHNIRCECYEPNARNHFRGSLSMAHAGKDTGGSQFFLTFLPTSSLNGRHTVFGRVIEGFDVLAKLVRVDPNAGSKRVSKIIKAEVIRDRGHDYSTRFERLPGR